jgi:guanine deaminase
MSGNGLSPHHRYLEMAVDEALRGAQAGRGGPFGAVVVREGTVLAVASNEVLLLNDPTAHAEVQAIRLACAALSSFQLDGCDVYASCEPCPMCLGALYWARPRAVYFAATRADAAAAGFDDAFIYDELAVAPEARKLPVRHQPLPGAARPFEAWLALTTRVPY